ncbi:MAG: hypothetical protein ABFS37_07990 [Acidobacteriota bacterium]
MTKLKIVRMTTVIRRLALAVLVLVPAGCGNAPLPPDPPSAIPTAELVQKHFPPETIIQDLLWDFSVSTEQSDAGKTTRTLFVSSEPIEESSAGGIFLRASLTTRTFDQPALASEAFAEQADDADPDTGLTYAWDLVLLDETRIHHLHADCLFSEEAFDAMSANLLEVVIPTSGSVIRCRCGGGCRQTNAADQ